MIVKESHVTAALEYLSDDPHPIAVARKAVTDAENEAKQIFARSFLAGSGSVDARKAQAEINEEYVAAKDRESSATYLLERAKARAKSAEMIIEIWRSENANARAAERIR